MGEAKLGIRLIELEGMAFLTVLLKRNREVMNTGRIRRMAVVAAQARPMSLMIEAQGIEFFETLAMNLKLRMAH